jgi:hypothetical protein
MYVIQSQSSIISERICGRGNSKMEMTSYGRWLATPAAASALTPVAAARVKLVFTDEIGAFVRHNRGFSTCWYLIPRSARLVGDLLHEIAQEFELLARCPLGLELLLDGFHVLANQEISMVRDNDTLVVQCAAFVGETDEAAETRASDKQVVKKRRRAQQQGEEDKEMAIDLPIKKKNKRESAVERVVEKKTKKATSSGELQKKRTDVVTTAAEKKQKDSPSNPKRKMPAPLVDSSSDSSESSSGEEDKEPRKPVVVKATKHALRQVVKQAIKSMKQDVSNLSSNAVDSSSDSDSDSDSDSSSSSSSSSSSEDDDNRKGPVAKPVANGRKSKPAIEKQDGGAETRTRRRRRPRRRPKTGDGATSKGNNVAKSTGYQLKTNDKKPTSSITTTTTNTTLPTLADTKEIRPLRIRGVPPAGKNGRTTHVRFDGSLKQTVAHAETALVPSDLHKYGPRAANTRAKNAAPAQVPVSLQVQSTEDPQSEELVVRKPVKEMWKRPYEIISSIHDVKDEPAIDSKEKPVRHR